MVGLVANRAPKMRRTAAQTCFTYRLCRLD